MCEQNHMRTGLVHIKTVDVHLSKKKKNTHTHTDTLDVHLSKKKNNGRTIVTTRARNKKKTIVIHKGISSAPLKKKL